MEIARFRCIVRYWNVEKASGLAVADVPEKHVPALGGLRQQHVTGTLNGVAFDSSLMPAGGGRLALSVSRAMQRAAGIGVGDEAEVEIETVGRS